MTPSLQQQQILDWFRNETTSAIVEAAAGSGKTSTLALVAQEIKPISSCVALAFAKVNAEDFKRKLPPHVQSSTFHSIWFRMLKRYLGTWPKVDGDKTFKWIKDNLSEDDIWIYGKFVNKLVGFAKNAGIGVLVDDVALEWETLIEHHGMYLESRDGDLDEAISIAQRALADAKKDRKVIDFDDMLYLSLAFNVQCDKYNVVMLDEAQDTNSVQRSLLRRMVAPQPYGRLIAVGDPNQSIYGFRGADADAMEQLKTDFNCCVLPLSVSWRCSRAVVEEARKVLT